MGLHAIRRAPLETFSSASASSLLSERLDSRIPESFPLSSSRHWLGGQHQGVGCRLSRGLSGEVEDYYRVAPMTFRPERAGVSVRLLDTSNGAGHGVL